MNFPEINISLTLKFSNMKRWMLYILVKMEIKVQCTKLILNSYI